MFLIKNKKRIWKGSVAVFALIIMFILAVATIGIITTASIERKTSISTGNSTTAFQIAESGMERTLQDFKSRFDEDLSDIGCSGSGNSIVVGTNTVKFRALGETTNYLNCSEPISRVKTIKSIGTTKQETRAIEQDVFLGATKLLLHFNGKNNDGDFEDSSFYYSNRTIDTIASGSGKVDAETEGIIPFPPDGDKASALFSGGGYLKISDSDDWDFKGGDFTIDFWVKFKALPTVVNSSAGIYSQYHNINRIVAAFLLNDNGTYRWIFEAEGEKVSAPADLPLDTGWHHIAYVKKGSNFKIFQNGSLLSTTGSIPANMPNYNDDVFIGWRGDASNYLNGYIDELRVSKGVARWWTSNFTPPNAEYWPD